MPRSSKKGCNPLVAILILGAVFLVALVISLFIGKTMLESWVQGDGFREWVRKKAAVALKADVGIEELKWSGPKKATIGTVSAKGYEDAAFSSFELNGIRAGFDIKDKAVKIPEISISRGHTEFSDNRISRKASGGETSAENPNEDSSSGKPPGVPGFLAKYAPNRVEIDRVTIGNASIDVMDENGQVALALKDAQSEILPNLESGEMVIKAQGGRLLLAGAPEMSIRDSSMRFRDDSLFINNAALGIYGSGHIDGSGEVSFADIPTLDLDLNLSGVDIKEVVSEDLRNRVSGTIRGPVRIKGTTDDAVTEGTIYLDDGVLEGIELLDKIADYTGSQRFSHLVLNQAQADFTMEGENLQLRNIQFQSDGLTRIEGGLDKSGDLLDGTLQIGITPGTLRWIPGAEQSVFTENRDGFVWTSVKIGGTVANVREDLSGRIIAAAAARIIERLPGGVEKRLKEIVGGGQGNEPGQPGEGGDTEITDRIKDVLIDNISDPETIETGKRVIDLLGPLLSR